MRKSSQHGATSTDSSHAGALLEPRVVSFAGMTRTRCSTRVWRARVALELVRGHVELDAANSWTGDLRPIPLRDAHAVDLVAFEGEDQDDDDNLDDPCTRLMSDDARPPHMDHDDDGTSDAAVMALAHRTRMSGHASHDQPQRQGSPPVAPPQLRVRTVMEPMMVSVRKALCGVCCA